MKVLAADRSEPPPGSDPPAREQAREQERQLVGQAQRGDLGAFEALYRLHLPRIYGLCWRLARDDAGAEELAQETFVRAWANLAGFRGDAAFATWLSRLAVNLALNERKSRRRAPWLTSLSAWTEATGRAAPARSPETGFDLDRALRALPLRARTVFVLHEIEGHGHDEIASLMGVDPGTSRSQLHRARQLLREALDP